MSFESNRPQPSVANINFVTRRLAVGGDLSFDRDLGRRQLDELVRLGITHVIDVRLEWSDIADFAEHAPAISYLHAGIDDAGQRVPGSWFDHITSWAADALSNPKAVVLTHCHMGINRGPSAGFAVLLSQGWDPIEALDAIRAARPLTAIAYAEDALRWHHGRTATTRGQRRADIARVAAWRRDNDIDLATILRRIRQAGSG